VFTTIVAKCLATLSYFDSPPPDNDSAHDSSIRSLSSKIPRSRTSISRASATRRQAVESLLIGSRSELVRLSVGHRTCREARQHARRIFDLPTHRRPCLGRASTDGWSGSQGERHSEAQADGSTLVRIPRLKFPADVALETPSEVDAGYAVLFLCFGSPSIIALRTEK